MKRAPAFLRALTPIEKYPLLHQELSIQHFFQKNPLFHVLMEQMSIEERYVLEIMIFLGAEALFSWPYELSSALLPLQLLARDLLAVETFYGKMGGLFGYYQKILELSQKKREDEKGLRFFTPQMIDIRKETKEVQEMALLGLRHLPEFAAIFPIGGVGDRLGLIDPATKENLPTAMLPFLGKTLFDLLIRDLASLEYLYRNTFGKEIFLPIVVMTSQEKQNHDRILSLCEEREWFGRPKESFCIIQQVSVPVITESGKWVIPAPLQLSWKPGGHGMLWKLMQDKQVFPWLFSLGKDKAFVRQINNPVAGTDRGLLSLMGIGAAEKKAFGFAACPRRVHAAEGIDVLCEKKGKNGYEYGFTNIEYTDFERWKIQDTAVEGGLYSEFPSNTNLLYVDLHEVQQAIGKDPFIGMMLNMKTTYCILKPDGSSVEERGGRIELMMQSIANSMRNCYQHSISKEEQRKLKTFVIYNERKKAISTTKRLYEKGQQLMETPEGCFFDLLQNSYDLLSQMCHMELPLLGEEEQYLKEGPAFIALFHPALGPLYSEIQKKISGGKLHYGAELQLEIADLLMEHVEVKGSLLVMAKHPSKNVVLGRCRLSHVYIDNEGIDRRGANVYWQNKIERKEALEIILHGTAEFVAENVTFRGPHKIEVSSGSRMVAFMDKGFLSFREEAL